MRFFSPLRGVAFWGESAPEHPLKWEVVLG